MYDLVTFGRMEMVHHDPQNQDSENAYSQDEDILTCGKLGSLAKNGKVAEDTFPM